MDARSGSGIQVDASLGHGMLTLASQSMAGWWKCWLQSSVAGACSAVWHLELEPICCSRSAWCRSIFVDRRHSNSTSMSPLMLAHHYQHGCLLCTCWIWSVPRCTIAGAISHTTAGLDYELIAVTFCRKHGTFHHHSSVLNQVLNRPVWSTELLKALDIIAEVVN